MELEMWTELAKAKSLKMKLQRRKEDSDKKRLRRGRKQLIIETVVYPRNREYVCVWVVSEGVEELNKWNFCDQAIFGW